LAKRTYDTGKQRLHELLFSCLNIWGMRGGSSNSLLHNTPRLFSLLMQHRPNLNRGYSLLGMKRGMLVQRRTDVRFCLAPELHWLGFIYAG
jgi:hypothetical protein